LHTYNNFNHKKSEEKTNPSPYKFCSVQKEIGFFHSRIGAEAGAGISLKMSKGSKTQVIIVPLMLKICAEFELQYKSSI
jgi:hypothetical protein